MSTPEYTIVARAQIAKWDNTLQTTVEGWQLDVRWTTSGTILRVFVPLDKYNPTNVDAAIRQAGYLDDEIGRLGQPAA